MKKRHFDMETDGFYGAYWKCKTGSGCAMIAMIGDDSEDYLARTSVKWLHKLGVNVMTMSPGKKDYGHHNYPLERIEKAINWLKVHGNQKIGIVGASTTGTLALTAASYFEDITLTIGLTPSDFIWQGFMQGKKDGCKEWPIEGESLFSYKGEPLPYMPFCYKHPDYWHVIEKETKRTGDMINSRKLFDDSETAHPITEDEMIKIEKINGTHFVFPESMLKTMLPVGSGLFVKLAFQAARKYPEECRRARLDIDRRVRNAVAEWKSAKETDKMKNKKI